MLPSPIMEWFVRNSSLFFLGGFLGWILEILFRRFVSQKKWMNPGFLTGPLLPIYGFGLFIFYSFSEQIPWQSLTPNPAGNVAIEIAALALMMTAIEYVGGLIFIKGMKIKLWDYSHQWGNIQGIICPAFSALWAACGAIYVLFLHRYFVVFSGWVWDNFLYTGIWLGVFYGILAVDFAWSMGLVAKIRKAVADGKLVVDWDKIKVSFREHYRKLHLWSSWALPFKTRHEEFGLLMKEYVQALRDDNALRASEQLKKLENRRLKKEARLAARNANKNHTKGDSK